MEIAERGLALIKESEGLELTAYQDPAGIWTIGYGHTNEAPSGDVYPVYAGQTITEAMAEEILKADIVPFQESVTAALTREISQNQFDALVSFTYNLGAGTFNSSDLLAKTNAGDFAGAAEEFGLYIYAGGVVQPGLVTRRQNEKELYLLDAPPATEPEGPSESARINALIGWFEQRLGGVTYSMTDRLGPSSYDCSSAVYLALAEAGFVPGNTMGNTDSLFGDLERYGWTPVPESNGSIPARRGDIFIWGIRGNSTGALGHTGVFYDDSDKIINCNAGNNGITIDDHDAMWTANQQPPVTVYRYTASGAPQEPPVVEQPEQPPAPEQPPTPGLSPYSGVFYPNIQLPVSGDTDPASPALAQYQAGSAIPYDSYIFTNGYAWISYIAASGLRRYIAVGPDDGRTDTIYGTGFLNNVPAGSGGSQGLIRYAGVFYPSIQLPVSADTDPDSPAVAVYAPGTPIIYDSYVFTNGYAWISYEGSSGLRRYIAVGPDDGRTDTVWGTGFLSNGNDGGTQDNPGPAQLYPKLGQFVPDRRLPVSGDTDPNSPELAAYDAGSAIPYDSYIFENGYAWISYVAASGNRRYIAVGPDDGRIETVWGRGFFN